MVVAYLQNCKLDDWQIFLQQGKEDRKMRTSSIEVEQTVQDSATNSPSTNERERVAEGFDKHHCMDFHHPTVFIHLDNH